MDDIRNRRSQPAKGGPSVVVVGAGPGGLAAAYRLQKAGAHVTVLDQNDRVGGKIKTRHVDGFHLDLGPTMIPPSHTHMLALIKELGIEDKLEACGSILGIAQRSGILYLDSTRFGKEILSSPLLSWRAKLSLATFVFDLWKARRELRSDDLSVAADLDTESAADYAYRRLNPALFDDLLDLMLRGQIGTSGAHLSKVVMFKKIDIILRNPGITRCFTLGLEQYAEALAKHFPVQLGAAVQEIVESPQGVTITYKTKIGDTKTVQADTCIVTTDAPTTAKILPQLTQDHRAFLNSVKYSVMTNMHAALKKRPDVPAFYILVPTSIHPSLLGIVLEHQRAPKSVPAGKGFVSVYPATDLSLELYDMADTEVTKRLTAITESIIPNIGQDIESSFINRWPRVVPSSHPGMYKQIRTFTASLPWKRIHLAGDYLSLPGMSAVIATAENTAKQALGMTLQSAT